MNTCETIEKIKKQKLVAVIRANRMKEAVQYCEETINGGIGIIEVTMTTPRALEIIKELSQKYEEDSTVLIGAGTVLDSVTARLAILNGAEFIVSPSFNEEVVKLCNLYQVPFIPGVMTVNEAVEALQAGCSTVKLFPGDVFGPKMIKSLRGPLPQLNIMPTGGVDLHNLEEWLKAGAIAVGIGNDLTREALKTGDLSSVRKKAEAYLSVVKRCMR